MSSAAVPGEGQSTQNSPESQSALTGPDQQWFEWKEGDGTRRGDAAVGTDGAGTPAAYSGSAELKADIAEAMLAGLLVA